MLGRLSVKDKDSDPAIDGLQRSLEKPFGISVFFACMVCMTVMICRVVMECMAVTVWMTYMAQKGSTPDMVWVA